MPELAEVEFYRKQWNPGLNAQVVSVELHAQKRIFRGVDTGDLVESLGDARMTGSASHGKQMCFFFNAQIHFGIHLGMTGKLRSEPSERFSKFKHDHLVLHMSNGRSLIFSDPRMFGRVQFSATAPKWWTDLPPAILSDGFQFERMNAFLNRRARSKIKAILLMQEVFPGIGNWMADEILWRSQIRPQATAASLNMAQRQRLYAKVQEVSADAMRVIGSDWGTPPNDWLFNHRWQDGGQCPQTRSDLVRETIGGRTTCWSPQWQTEPS